MAFWITEMALNDLNLFAQFLLLSVIWFLKVPRLLPVNFIGGTVTGPDHGAVVSDSDSAQALRLDPDSDLFAPLAPRRRLLQRHWQASSSRRRAKEFTVVQSRWFGPLPPRWLGTPGRGRAGPPAKPAVRAPGPGPRQDRNPAVGQGPWPVPVTVTEPLQFCRSIVPRTRNSESEVLTVVRVSSRHSSRAWPRAGPPKPTVK